MTKYLILAMACWGLRLPSSVAATADEVAREVIKDESAGAHNPSNDAQEELQKTAAANSRLRLKWLMLNDSGVSEEVRICYAIRVIDDKLGLYKILRGGAERTPQEEELLKKRLLLGKRLIELDQTKAEQAEAGHPATIPKSGSDHGENPQPESKSTPDHDR